MRGQPNGHTVAFRAKHLMSGEAIFGYLEGWIIALTPNGAEDYMSGQLILTNRRLCLYRKALLGERLSEIELSEVTSIEDAERSGFRFVRVRSNAKELTFRSAEEENIWHLVIDRLRMVQADPSWEPPQCEPATRHATQPASLRPPAARYAVPGRTPTAILIDRLARQHELDELFVSPVDQSAIGLNFREKKLVLTARSRELSYRFDQIVSVEVAANDVTLSQTNRGSQLVGAAIGGVLLGGTGILLGGLTGSSRATPRVKDMALKLAVDDRTTPSHTIRFFVARDKKGLPSDNPAVAAAEAAIERMHAQIILAMREAQSAEVQNAPTDLGDLERLWELRERGALTEAEFEEQKRRLLGAASPIATPSPVASRRFALCVLDWGRDKVSVLKEMREMEPSLGLGALMKMYGSPSYCVAHGLPLPEAARIKARLFAVGVTIEMLDEEGATQG